jgi:general secretion pathway protein G
VKRAGSALLWALALPLAVLLALALISPCATRCAHYNRANFAKMQIVSFMAVLETYRSDVRSFPTEEQGLEALWTDPGVRGWNGPYLSRDVPLDPWGVPYRYSLTGGRPSVSSIGSPKTITISPVPHAACP